MAKRFFCSDWHLFHSNIIGFSDMPFKDIHEHDEAILTLHNERVKPEDRYYMLGDATLIRGGKAQQEKFINFAKKFNGHGTIFLGNHDHFEKSVYLQVFEDIRATWRDQENIIYSHFPLHPSTLSGVRAMVHGHIHTNESPSPAVFYSKSGIRFVVPYINVCLEKTNYAPIDMEELETRINQAREKWITDNPELVEGIESIDPGSQDKVS